MRLSQILSDLNTCLSFCRTKNGCKIPASSHVSPPDTTLPVSENCKGWNLFPGATFARGKIPGNCGCQNCGSFHVHSMRKILVDSSDVRQWTFHDSFAALNANFPFFLSHWNVPILQSGRVQRTPGVHSMCTSRKFWLGWFTFGPLVCRSEAWTRSVRLPKGKLGQLNHTWLVVWNMNLMTFHILEISSSQLTNSYFSEGLKPSISLVYFSDYLNNCS